jgi:hypothetical protein
MAPMPAGSARRAPGVQWITCDPAFVERERRRLAVAIWIIGALPLLPLILLIWLIPAAFVTAKLLPAIVALVVLSVLPLLAFVHAAREVARRRSAFRMGTSDEGLRVVSMNVFGKVEESFAPWAEVYTDGKRFVAGTAVVLLRQPLYGAMFDARALETVFARIPPGNRVSSARLTAKSLRARPREAAIVAVLLAACLVVILAQYLRLL